MTDETKSKIGKWENFVNAFCVSDEIIKDKRELAFKVEPADYVRNMCLGVIADNLIELNKKLSSIEIHLHNIEMHGEFK